MSSRASSLYLVLLLVSALFVSISAVTVPERAYAAVTLTNIVPNPQAPGFTVQVVGSTTVMTNVVGCRVTADNPAIIKAGSVTCVFGPVGASTPIYASFVVANYWGGNYNLFLQTLASGGSVVETSAATAFTVSQTISLSASVVTVGQTVTVTGAGFLTGDNPCTITGGSGGSVGTFTCNVGANGLLTTTSFTVVAAGAVPEAIIVTGATGSTPAVPPFLWVVSTPTIVLNPTNAAPGFGTLPTDGSGRVAVVGGGFTTSSAARSCTIQPLTGLFATSPTVYCSISTDGSMTGYFAVSKTAAPGGYTVTVKDSATAETASAAFTVNPKPDIWFPVASTGVAGNNIAILTLTTNFSPLEAGACSLSTTGPGTLYTSPICAIDFLGAVDFMGMSSFVVGNTAPGGTYYVTVTGNKGEYTDPIAFTVLAAATLSPSSGSPPVVGPPAAAATEVTITGTGFPSSDSGCALVSVAGLVYDTTGEPCTVNSSGQLNAKFRVGTQSLYGVYTINVKTTHQAPVAVSPTFTVQPQIVLSPASGSAGTTVSVYGSGFSNAGGACTIGPSPAIVTAGYICTQTITGIVNGQFSVASPAPIPGSYFITVTDAGGAPPSADAQFVITGGPSIAFSPTVGTTGTTITVTSPSGGWNSLDNTVTLTKAAGSPAGDLWIMPNPTCPVSGGSIGACTFTVKSNAVGGMWTITITGNKGDMVNAQFMLIATLILTPTSSGSGVAIQMSGSGYQAGAPTDCKAGTTSIPAVPALFSTGANPASCSIDPTGFLTGAFTVAATAALTSYTVTITTLVPQTTLSTAFTVTHPTVVFSANSGSGGDTITVSGTGFSSGDTTCTIAGGTPDIAASFSCTITAGVVTGSFVVGGAGIPAQSVAAMTVKGNLLDSASATFNVVPKVSFSPNPARVKSTVTVTGTNFVTSGDKCNFAGASVDPTSTPTAANCVRPDYTLDPTIATFVVLKTFAGLSDTIIVSETTTPTSASATLNMIPHVVTLSPASGPVGASISVTGTGFTTTDTAASTIAGIPVTGGSVACTTAVGGTITCSFVVDAGPPPTPTGTYALTLTGDTDGDVGTASFTVEAGVSILPASGRPGTNVLVSGSNFAAGDTGCSITSSPSGLISSPLCTVAGGAMSGSFTVASGTSGPYQVIITGTTGDAGQATFNVPLAPSLTLTPNPANAGSVVTASGTDYLGTTCLLTSAPSGLFSSSPSCSIAAGTLTATGTVASGASGSYTVTVTTNAGSGDSATSDLSITAGPVPTLTLTPITGSTGTVVTGTGTGFTADVTCVVTAAPSAVLASSSCTLTGGGAFTVGFTVPSSATPGTYAIIATGNTGKAASALFTVQSGEARQFSLTPTIGRVGTVVTASGSHFAGITCSLTSSPSGLLSAQSCSLSGGTLTGGFTVAAGAVAGGYTVTVTTDVTSDTISQSFTVPIPTLILSPSTGAAGTTVTATGSNYAGSTCTLTSLPTGLFTGQVCAISAAGALTGGFTVASDAASGIYTVMATTASEAPTATFTVPVPHLTLSPSSGAVGTAVSVSGTNFVGSTCSISSSPSGLISSPTCLIVNGNLDGGFVVATGAALGGYTVSVTPDLFGATPASASFTVPSPTTTTKTLNLSPGSGATGTAVSVSGQGYLGTNCQLTSSGLFGSAACAISGGRLSGGFTVASNAAVGSYTVTVTSDVSSDTTSAVFSVTKPTTPYCIIATTTFGSEAAPAVQLLRNFRDGLALNTRAGSAFMTVFNAWYYSFSPTVAGFIASHDPIRAPMKVIIYPLLGILSASTLAYSIFSWTPEFGILMAGLVASSLIGLVYLTPFMLVSMRALTRRKRINTISIAKASLLVLATALGLLTAGELAGSFLILAVASSAIVLTCIIAAPTIVALLVLRPKSQ